MKELVEKLSALFAYSGCPMLGVENKIILFANPAAASLFGPDIIRQPADRLIPSHILDTKADSFVSSAKIHGKSMTVSAAGFEGLLLLSIIPEDEKNPRKLFAPAQLISSMRSSAFTLKLAADQLLGQLGDNSGTKLNTYASMLYNSFYRILRLTSNLDTANRLSDKSLAFSPRVCNMYDLCSQLVSSVAHFTSDKEIEISFICERDKIFSCVDEEKIEQLLLNLISNSLAHTSAGCKIEVALKSDGPNLILSVDDNGSGISDEIMGSIFTRFEKDFTLAQVDDGPGLGLGIAKGIAELHGGALVVESRPGIKTSVRVMLPNSIPPATVLRSQEPHHLDAATILCELAPIISSRYYTPKYFD